jgi:hypothetical protein
MHPKYMQFAAAWASFDGQYRVDAGETAVMARELEHVAADVTRVIYPTLKSRDFVPMIEGGVDPGADAFTWRGLDLAGYAELIGNGAKDLPSVEIDEVERSRPIRSFGAQYGYTVQDLRSFALAQKRGGNVALDREKATGARLIIERKHDAMVALGDTRVSGLTGFINDPNVSIASAGVSLNGSWATQSPDAILADMNYMVQTVITQSLDVIEPDTLVLPSAQHSIVTTRRLGTGTDTTIAKFFEANTGVKVAKWNLLKGRGAGNADRMVCYKRDPLIAGCVVPIVFQAQAPQLKGFRFNIPCEGRSGGTIVRVPLGMLYGDGI